MNCRPMRDHILLYIISSKILSQKDYRSLKYAGVLVNSKHADLSKLHLIVYDLSQVLLGTFHFISIMNF